MPFRVMGPYVYQYFPDRCDLILYHSLRTMSDFCRALCTRDTGYQLMWCDKLDGTVVFSGIFDMSFVQ